MKRIFGIENYTTSQMLIVIAVIIVITPPGLVLISLMLDIDSSKSGTLGDTIGGLTSPFINGLAAILVFIAFKAQIKANELFRKQEQMRTILDQINLIQEDKLGIERIIGVLIGDEQFLSREDINTTLALNKIIHFSTELTLTNELINKFDDEKDFVYKKLYFLYEIRYKELFETLEANVRRQKAITEKYFNDKKELLDQILILKRELTIADKFKAL